MKNRYEIRGEFAAIFFNTKLHGEIETLVDISDLQKVLIGRSVYGSYDRTVRNYYVYIYLKENGKRTRYALHRFLMNCPIGKQVDHVNRNTLDNRRSNLRIVSGYENVQNRSAISRGKSGHKNVTYVPKLDKWQVRVTIQGKRHSLGFFDKLEDAIRKAKESRSYFHQYSKDHEEMNLPEQYDPFIHRKEARSSSKSGVKGIGWSKSKNKWIIYVYANGKTKTIGRTNDLEEAKKILTRYKEMNGEVAN